MTAQPSVTLTALFADIPIRPLGGAPLPVVAITGIAFDSRSVRPGDLFVAIQGVSADGHRFIPAAVEHGAAAVVGSRPAVELAVPYIQVEDTAPALAYLAAAFNGFPARRLTVIGVTGTDGKTTTANLLYQILREAGLAAGMISTVNAVIGDEVIDTGFHVTTPEATDVQGYLARMAAAGLSHVILEATSHGLAQHRVTACEFDLAIMTNITHEHLDYHGSYDHYRAAKARLFTGLAETRPKPGGIAPLAVLNRDDGSYEYLAGLAGPRQAAYSQIGQGDVNAGQIRFLPDGMSFQVSGPGFELPFTTRLAGAFNVSNSLAAITAAVLGLGVPAEAAARGIAQLAGVPGRMERIDLGQDFTALVDFAHTPNALRRALETVRQMTGGRVLAVFGSAGLRDRAKRRMMAQVAAELADISILTAEDPRTESLDAILAEMAAAAAERGGIEGKTFFRVPDRPEALRLAVQMAHRGDLVISCGKGHEQSMCFGSVEYPWDDRTALRAALAERLGIAGPQMPALPTGR